MTLTKGFVRLAATTALDTRLMDAAQFVRNADGSPRTGVLGGFPSIVTTTAGMTVNVAAAAFVSTRGVADGVNRETNDGTVAVTIPAAPGSNSRFDLISVKHNDADAGDGSSLPVFVVTSGSAAASPTVPATPTGCEPLATLRIYSGTVATNGGSNVLTNVYRMTAMSGGVVPFRTIAERDLWTSPAPCDGQLAYCIAEDATFEYVDGTVGWVHLLGKPIVSTITFTGIYSGASARVTELGGRVFLEGSLAATSATFAGNTAYSFGSIPAAKSPVATRRWVTMINGVLPATITLTSAGALTIIPSAGFTSTMDAPLDMCSWHDKRLG